MRVLLGGSADVAECIVIPSLFGIVLDDQASSLEWGIPFLLKQLVLCFNLRINDETRQL